MVKLLKTLTLRYSLLTVPDPYTRNEQLQLSSLLVLRSQQPVCPHDLQTNAVFLVFLLCSCTCYAMSPSVQLLAGPQNLKDLFENNT